MAIQLLRECERFDCAVRFEPPSVNVRFCPSHRSHNPARDARAEHDRHRVCERCGKPYIATGTRQQVCQDCMMTPPPPHFVAIDGEGVGHGKNHRYVLLGVGDRQKDYPDGISSIDEVFSFLYERFESDPGATYVGFFLGYDFNMWLRPLPRMRAWQLLTDKGRMSRQRRVGKRLAPWPVEYQGWEFDMLGMKRLKLRPRSCDCKRFKGQPRCEHPVKPWMYINDTGPFFQASLLSVIDPKEWRNPVVSNEEYEILKQGKERRDHATLDDEMRMYNRLENAVLPRVLSRLNDGFTHAGVKLNKKQWFGPGQAAQAWLRLDKKLDPTMAAIKKWTPRFRDKIIASYYGGWFEIVAHGHVPGLTYEYDINSAYPCVASRLPCLCGTWTHGKGTPKTRLSHRWLAGESRTPNDGRIRLCHVIVRGRDKWLGPLPHRDKDGQIARPLRVEGWYWQHEIDAARKAGLIYDVDCLEWHEYKPCEHKPPLRGLVGLYEGRQRIGKDTAEGKAYKLVYNSIYGKLAQSLGEPAFANPMYASLITSGCRTAILNAIATHPDRSDAVVMVATDAVYFTAPHPSLPMSEKLGEWSSSIKTNLTLFKPGVYWDDKTRHDITEGKRPRFKARGINAEDFAKSIAEIDRLFDSWRDKGDARWTNDDWPEVEFRSRFSQVSILQAVQWSENAKTDAEANARYRRDAGRIIENKKLVQSSRPDIKRDWYEVTYDGIYRTRPWDGMLWEPSEPYNKKFGFDRDTAEFERYSTPDGPVMLQFRRALGIG